MSSILELSPVHNTYYYYEYNVQKKNDIKYPSIINLLQCQDSLGEDQKLKLEIARLIREDFLQQNSFTTFDYICPLYKTSWMLR